jgi:hypothetical protein
VTNRPQAEYFDEETYDDDHFRHPGPPQQHTYPDQHHADPAHYADDAGGEPYQGHEHHPLPPSPHQEYDDYRPRSHEEHAEHAYAGARPTSAPFPPPVPLPDSDEGWAPPPSMSPAEYAPNGQYPAARGGYAPAQQPPPPAPGSAPRPGPPPLAPWPESEHGGEQAEFEPHFPTHREHMQQPSPADWQAGYPAPAPLPRAEIGQLIENIPRSMRVAVPALIEVRVARADVRALAEGLQGGGAAYQHEVMVTKAMSVRLRAPDGGFFIETASPETQWIERAMLMSSDDFASWRWHVTPRDTGRRRLQLIISARTVSADGLAAETALPDQVISVRVRTNYAQSTKRWLGWGAAAVAGGLLAKFGEGAFASLGGFFG